MVGKRTNRFEGPVSPSDRNRRILATHASSSTDDDLPFTVELWSLSQSDIERVLGRANSATLAHAIFLAAQKEHLGRRITLRKGAEAIAESG